VAIEKKLKPAIEKKLKPVAIEKKLKPVAIEKKLKPVAIDLILALGLPPALAEMAIQSELPPSLDGEIRDKASEVLAEIPPF
jgi:hypothetical protein